MNPLDEKYGAKTTQVVDANNNIMQYDVLDEAIKNKEPLESAFEKVRYKDILTINDLNYYKEKYGNKSNPANPDALDDNEITSLYNKTKVLAQVNNKIRNQGYSFSDVSINKKVEQARAKTKGYIWNPFTTETNQVESYEGFVDYGTGSTAKLGTMQQLAENNENMLIKKIGSNGQPSYSYVKKPRTQREMHEAVYLVQTKSNKNTPHVQPGEVLTFPVAMCDVVRYDDQLTTTFTNRPGT